MNIERFTYLEAAQRRADELAPTHMVAIVPDGEGFIVHSAPFAVCTCTPGAICDACR